VPPASGGAGAEYSDEALVAATRAGDDFAFERLYKRYQRRIAAYIHGMVHDHGRAEDITQDVFMSALRRMRETDRPIIFKPWIYEIAKNACIDAFRRSKRAEEVSYDAEEGLGGADHGRLVSSTPTPDAAVDTRMSLDNLRGAFGGLSEMHHDILVMRELEGLSYREIGQRLGMSRPSVESTLFRARRRLTEEYEELASGERCRSVQDLIADGGGRRMGIRDERKMARHVSYCQPCRRAAYSAGFDVAALAAKKSLREKVAALLPIPAFLKRRWFGGGGHGSGSSLTSAASQYAEPASSWAAKAAAVVATVAVAGAGAGVATTHGTEPTPAPKQVAPVGAGLQPATAQKQAAASSRPSSTRSPSRAASSSSSSSKRSAKHSKAAAGKHRGGGSSASHAPAAGGGSRSSGPSGASGASGASAGGGGTSAAKGAGASGGASRTGSGATTTGAASKAVNRTTSTANKAVHDTTKAVDNTVNKTAGTVNKTVNNTTATANKAVTSATSAANTAVNSATGAVNNATNGAAAPATSAVNSAAGAATGAVNQAAGTATSAVNDAAGAATGAATGAVGAATGAVGGAAGGLVPGG
jgi:RNA polymerase sigma factor (sigma-70 family)